MISRNQQIAGLAVLAVAALSVISIASPMQTADAARDQNNRNECNNNVVGVCAGVNADVLSNGQVCVGVLQFTQECNR